MNNFKFLENSDQTGRFIVHSLRTGKKYYVEPIHSGERVFWGDINVATKRVEGNYGTKYKGSVDAKDSMITEQNGFKNISFLEKGVSPLSFIESLDEKYQKK